MDGFAGGLAVEVAGWRWRAGAVPACPCCKVCVSSWASRYSNAAPGTLISDVPHPLLAAASLLVNGKWVRRALPLVERLIRGRGLPERLLSPARPELVQIQKDPNRV